MSVRDMLELALQGFQPDILDSYHVTYKCDCSLERVEKMIRSLGKKEVEKMRDEDPIAEVNCQFCNKNYRVDLNDVLENWPDIVENEDAKKFEKLVKTLDFSAHIVYNNTCRPERATEQNLSNMRP